MSASNALKRAAWSGIVPAMIAAGLVGSVAAAPKPAATPDKPRRSLVLITLDTTRADHLGSYGWKAARTPNLDALAARGIRFVRCDTAAPVTLPSHATILTGLYPPRTGVRDNSTFVLADRMETVAERLAAHGYDTAAVVSAIVLARRHGLNQGFRIYDDDLGAGQSADTEVAERQAEPTTAVALAAAAKLKAPFFLWVHYYDPHEEYQPPTRFTSLGGPTRLYDGEIAAVDEQIGVLLSKLPKDVDVVVVGDHGEMLGEHGEQHHGLLLYRAARRVPLILAGPGVPSGRTQECLVRTADVAPTLLELAGVPTPPGLDGKSLLSMPGKTCDRTSYSESFLPFFAYKWYPLRALSTDRFFYLHAPKSSLYQIPSDPDETTDVGPEQPGALGLWEKRLRDQLKAAGEELEPEIRPENVISEEQRRQLASLGYVGSSGGGGAVRRDLPDPRAMAAIADALHDAGADIQQGKCKEALPRLQEIVKKDPHNFPALTLAGNCLEVAERWESALALFQRASKENELSAVPVANAAGCLKQLGRKAEAEKEYRRALALDSSLGEASSNLAQLLDGRGERAEALRVLDASIAAGSYSSEVYLERGLIQVGLNRIEDALRDFREAARRNPVNPVPLENAARAAYRLGRTRESVQLYEQLLRLQPGRVDLWKTAGALYLYELKDGSGAERCFRRALALETDPGEREKIEQALEEIAALS
jgi:arylsulfatase A-like enzyme/Flp pilus assembly protein TadD